MRVSNIKWQHIRNICCVLGLAVWLPTSALAKTDLVFIIDGSGSISAADFTLQKDGIIAALNNSLIVPRDGPCDSSWAAACPGAQLVRQSPTV